MTMPDPSLRKYTFLQCVILFWCLIKRVDAYDDWLWLNVLKRTWAGDEAELYKGWFFWMFINGLNSHEMQTCFNSQGWWGYSVNSDERWFRGRLINWGWSGPPRREPQIREGFFEFLRKIAPDSELQLDRDDPDISQCIDVPGWTLLPFFKANHHGEVSFSDLEEQALVLYDNKQAPSLRSTLNSYRPVNSSSSHPSAIGPGPFEQLPLPFTEPSGSTNLPTREPRAPNPPVHPPQPANEHLSANEAPKAINRANRPLTASQGTDHQPTTTTQIARSRPSTSSHQRPIISKNISNLRKVPSTPGGSSKRKLQSSISDNHPPRAEHSHNSNQRNVPRVPELVSTPHQIDRSQQPLSSMNAVPQSRLGQSMHTAAGIERPFPSTPHEGINFLNQPTLGINNSRRNPRGPTMMNIGQYRPQALSTLPSHPQGHLRPSLKYQSRQNGSPTMAHSNLPQQLLAQDDSSPQTERTPKRQRLGSFSPASVGSSFTTSSSTWSPSSQSSSLTSMTSNTPSQVYSASSSPLLSFPTAIPAKQRSSVGIREEAMEAVNQPPQLSPGTVVQAVNAKLSVQSENIPEASASSRHSTPSRDTLPCRALTYADKPMVSAEAEADRATQDPVSTATQARDIEAKGALVEVGKAISDNESIRSGAEMTDEDRDSILGFLGDDGDADEYDDFDYVVGLSAADTVTRLSQ